MPGGRGGLTRSQIGPEGELGMDVVGNLRKLGWSVWWLEQNRQDTRQTAGVADVLAEQGGTFLALELKANYETPSEHQVFFLRRWNRSGNPAAVVWSWTDVMWVLHQVWDGGLDPATEPALEELSLPRFARYNSVIVPEWAGVLSDA